MHVLALHTECSSQTRQLVRYHVIGCYQLSPYLSFFLCISELCVQSSSVTIDLG